MCVCTAFHVLYSGFLVLLVSTAVTRASSYMRAYGAKELWPYFRIRCDLNCPYGYETDIEGNYVCLCHDPCQNVRCFGHTRCTVELPKLCSRDYCRPRATCRDMGPLLPPPSLQNGVFLADDAATTSSDASLPNKCKLPVTDAAKNCRKLRTRWFFDDVTGTCQSFLGCKTTGNNFRGQRGCEKMCVVKPGFRKNRSKKPVSKGDVIKVKFQEQSSPQTSSVCYRPVVPDMESCRKAPRRWFYDVKSGTCRKFRSCPGSGNNFSRKRHCKSLCSDNTTFRRKGRRNHSRSANH